MIIRKSQSFLTDLAKEILDIKVDDDIASEVLSILKKNLIGPDVLVLIRNEENKYVLISEK